MKAIFMSIPKPDFLMLIEDLGLTPKEVRDIQLHFSKECELTLISTPDGTKEHGHYDARFKDGYLMDDHLNGVYCQFAKEE